MSFQQPFTSVKRLPIIHSVVFRLINPDEIWRVLARCKIKIGRRVDTSPFGFDSLCPNLFFDFLYIRLHFGRNDGWINNSSARIWLIDQLEHQVQLRSFIMISFFDLNSIEIGKLRSDIKVTDALILNNSYNK